MFELGDGADNDLGFHEAEGMLARDCINTQPGSRVGYRRDPAWRQCYAATGLSSVDGAARRSERPRIVYGSRPPLWGGFAGFDPAKGAATWSLRAPTP